MNYGEYYNSVEEGPLVERLVKIHSSGEVTDDDARRTCVALQAHAIRCSDAKAWARALSLCPRGAVLDCIGVQDFAHAYKRFSRYEFFDAVKSL